jgi:hypothetical protein
MTTKTKMIDDNDRRYDARKEDGPPPAPAPIKRTIAVRPAHSMKVVYVAHPLGGGPGREDNRRAAAKWVGEIGKLGVAPVADWIILSGQWPEEDGGRELGLRIDRALIERCDEIWLVGPRISPGMTIEAEHARTWGKPVRDLTECATIEEVKDLLRQASREEIVSS